MLSNACDCKGTMAYFHESCILQWLEMTGKKHCDICKARFRIRENRASFKRIIQYLIENQSRTPNSEGKLVIRLVLYYFLSGKIYPCLVYWGGMIEKLVVVVIKAMLKTFKNRKRDQGNQWLFSSGSDDRRNDLDGILVLIFLFFFAIGLLIQIIDDM